MKFEIELPDDIANKLAYRAAKDNIGADTLASRIIVSVLTLFDERRPTLHEADKSHDPRQDEYIPGLGWVPKVKY